MWNGGLDLVSDWFFIVLCKIYWYFLKYVKVIVINVLLKILKV